MESEPEEARRPVYGPVCKRMRHKRQKKLLVLLFLDFAKNTTLHGLKYVTETGLNYIEKLFWCVTFFGSAAICFFFIFNVWEKWRTSPVIVSFDAKHVSVNEVPFPSVTICPNAQFLQEKFNYTKVWDAYFDDMSNYAMDINNTDTLLNAERLALLCDVHYYSYTVNRTFKNDHFNASAMEFLYEMFVDYNDVFDTCEWRGNYNLCKDIFKKVLTKFGICFNFNGLQATDILNMDFVQREYNYTFASEEIRNWTMENGYSSDSYMNVYPHRGRENGGEPNLRIMLKDLDSKKDKKCNGLYSGYKIYLHHPADFPQALMYSFSAVPDQVTSMGVTFTMETANTDIKRHPVEMFLDFCDATWTAHGSACDHGGCNAAETSSNNDSTKICSPSKMYRVVNAEFTFTELEGPSEGKCKCLPSCNSIVYDAYTVKSDFHFEEYMAAHKTLYDGENLDTLNISSVVDIFFKQSIFTIVHRSELYGVTDFLGNCGGLLGLFLGFSWLSLVEILYFLTFRVYKTIKMDLRQEKADRWNEVLQKAIASKNL